MGLMQRVQQPTIRQFGGLNVKVSEMGLPGSDSPFMRNVDLHPEGSIRKRNGTLAMNSPAGKYKIDAMMLLPQPEASRNWLYVIAENTIYRTAEPATWSWASPTHASGYTLVAQNRYGRANSRYNDGTNEYHSVLYLPRSNGAPLIILGQTSATGDIITMPAGSYGSGAPGTGTVGYPDTWATGHWPKHMRMIGAGPSSQKTTSAALGARMHAWGMGDDRNKVYYSEMGVPWNFMRSNVDEPSASPQPLIDGGYYTVMQGDGDEIVAVVDMYSYVVIFKKNRTFIYSGDPGNVDDWTLRNVYPVGCVGDRAWIRVNNDILFWSVAGPKSLATVQEYGDLAYGDIGEKILPAAADIEPSSIDRICCYHDAKNQRVVWYVPLATPDHNDSAYVYYYKTGKWASWDGEGCYIMETLTMPTNSANNERHLAGTYRAGVVQLQAGFTDTAWDADAGEISEADVASDYYTNWIASGEISDATIIKWLDILAGDEGRGCEIYYQTDLNPDWKPITRIINAIGGSGTNWGFFKWGDGSKWGTKSRSMVRYEVEHVFNFIRFRFSKTSNYGFEIMGYRPELWQEGPFA